MILTSNLGSNFLLDGIGADGEITAQAKEQINALLKQSFRPEFLNRLDEIVFYKPLTRENMVSIVELQIADLNRRLANKQISCTVTPAAKDYIVEQAYDPVYGARPLRRYIEQRVETLIARKILADDLLPGAKLTVDAGAEGLTLQVR